ncbi:MAG: endonuclease III [Flavobacteriales bacterium]|nr:endonuclease III [Flavobacteriales bacterium]
MPPSLPLKERFRIVLQRLAQAYPEARTELHYRNPYELLVAVVLSAQCTDKRVNMVTPAFFERFPDVESLASAQEEEIFHYIRSISYPNSKSRHLRKAAQMIVEHFGGEIPPDPQLLQKLPGVGRKTAHVLASVLWEQPRLAVDTHVFRVSARIGLTRNARTPLQTEKQLTRHIPKELLPKVHHWLILHGRYVCKARKPLCSQCVLADVCRYATSPALKTGTAL